MNVLLYTINPSILNSLVRELTLFGVSLFHVKEPDEINRTIAEKEINCLLLDVDSKSIDWLRFLIKLKNDPKTSAQHIMIFTVSKEVDFINHFIIQGIDAVIDTGMGISQYLHRIKTILKNYEEKGPNKRKYSRIKPEEDEIIPVIVEFNEIPNVFLGKIVDISVMAAAIELQKIIRNNDIKDNFTIKSFQITLDGKRYSNEAEIIRRMDEILVIQYPKKQLLFEKALINYIFNKINISHA